MGLAGHPLAVSRDRRGCGRARRLEAGSYAVVWRERVGAMAAAGAPAEVSSVPPPCMNWLLLLLVVVLVVVVVTAAVAVYSLPAALGLCRGWCHGWMGRAAGDAVAAVEPLFSGRHRTLTGLAALYSLRFPASPPARPSALPPAVRAGRAVLALSPRARCMLGAPGLCSGRPGCWYSLPLGGCLSIVLPGAWEGTFYLRRSRYIRLGHPVAEPS